MPTRYTAEIQKGISFNKYALGCSKAFGALVMMQDDPLYEEITEKLEPDDYHLKKKINAKDELKSLNLLTVEEADKAALDKFNSDELYRVDKLIEDAVIKSRYNDMLDKAKAWVSPSKNHDELKKFMISQIEDSIKFNCAVNYYNITTIKITGELWRKEKTEQLIKDIMYHDKQYRKEIERTNDRNKWVSLLLNSLSL